MHEAVTVLLAGQEVAAAPVLKHAQDRRAKGLGSDSEHVHSCPASLVGEFTAFPNHRQSQAEKENAKVKKSYKQEVLICVSHYVHWPYPNPHGCPSISLFNHDLSIFSLEQVMKRHQLKSVLDDMKGRSRAFCNFKCVDAWRNT